MENNILIISNSSKTACLTDDEIEEYEWKEETVLEPKFKCEDFKKEINLNDSCPDPNCETYEFLFTSENESNDLALNVNSCYNCKEGYFLN